ncbi:MAG: aminotransferase class I/II-fold pyridoxal phosphate-dependent enzyme [Nocardioides sp.]
MAALEGGANQYAPGVGVPALRRAVAAHQQRHYGIELDPDRQVVVTTGCTEAIAAILGLVDPGDEVVVLEPYYDSMSRCCRWRAPSAGRSHCAPPTSGLDVDALAAVVGPRTRFVLLNSPTTRPAPCSAPRSWQPVARVAIEHDPGRHHRRGLRALTFDGAQHMPATLPGMAERTLTLSSVGKSYSLTGWKVGWATARPTWSRPCSPQAVAHVRLGRAAPAGRRLRARRGARLPPCTSGRPAAASRPAVRGPPRPVCHRPPSTYFATTDIGALGWADGRDSASRCPSAPA